MRQWKVGNSSALLGFAPRVSYFLLCQVETQIFVIVRAQARKVKKRLGPRLNQAILRVLTDGVCNTVSLCDGTY